MIRSIFSLPLATAILSIAAANFAMADCTTCGGGCATGNCATGGYVSAGAGCLSGDCNSGPCRTCTGLWDDYCATKNRCLKNAKYPLQNYHGHGGCNTCGNAGVGIYANSAGCGCGVAKKLFHHHAAPAVGCDSCEAPCADGGCSDSGYAAGCSSCAAATSAPVSHQYGYTAPKAQSAPVATSPVIDVQPVGSGYAGPSYLQPSRTSIPQKSYSAPITKPVSIPPVPPAPALNDQTSTGAFDWLQRALKLN